MISSGHGVRIGEIGGHEIRLDVFLFGFFALYIFYFAHWPTQPGVAFLVAGFLTILIHELGHAVTIRWLVGEYTMIVIGFGGYTLSSGRARPAQQLLISLAGPAAGLLQGGFCWGISHLVVNRTGPWPWDFYAGESIWLMVLLFLIWTSLVWSVINLLPAVPLDGGKALRSLLVVSGMAGFRARRLTRRLGLAISAAGAIFGFSRGMPILGVVMLWILFTNLEESVSEGF
ncbi:MAG: metalloprotease [Planctomycetota bacterium]